jgi:hypothetical protein
MNNAKRKAIKAFSYFRTTQIWRPGNILLSSKCSEPWHTKFSFAVVVLFRHRKTGHKIPDILDSIHCLVFI